MSPYGLSKDVGGDTPELTRKMESCVAKVTKQGHSKVSAIKICKHMLQKAHGLKTKKKG